jgi:hypothetical protein
MMKNVEFLKWLKQFIKDKDVLSSIQLIEIKDALAKLHWDDVFKVEVSEREPSNNWNSTMTFPSPLFKNPYNYEITKVDKESDKK